MTQFPQLPAPADLAAAGPKGAKKMLAKAAAPLPAAELAPFFEQACRELVRAGESELAFWAFGQARKVEKDHPALLDLDRVQDVFLELVPAGGVGPTALRDYAKTLAAELSGEEAHTRFREVICAGFDAGLIPYARIFPDLRTLARAAKIKKRDEEAFLAERLLRAGLMPIASHQVWAAAREPLAAVAGRDDDLMELLIAAEPDRARHEEESGEEVAEEIRQMWLESLAESGAGAHLSAQWFGATGRGCAAEVLLKLVDQAGDRLFPKGEVVFGEETDPALPPPDYRHIIPRKEITTDSPRWWDPGFDVGQQAADVASGPEGRERFASLLDAFVRDMGYFGNVDYAATVKVLWDLPETREVLSEAVDAWKADAGCSDLPFMYNALHQLVRLTSRGGLLDLEPGVAEGLEPSDPVDALLATLRGGIPAELAVTGGSPHKSPKAGRTIVQHLGYLTITERSWNAYASVTGDDELSVRLPQLPDGLLPWYDGKTGLLSRIQDGVWQTFRVEGQTGQTVALTLDPDTATARPQAPGTSEVTFPGAAGPSEIRLSRGAITVTAPDGTRTARLLFSPIMSTKSALVPPPGWWPRRDPVDPDGSAALRRFDRERAARLLEATLTGPRAATDALEAVLPEVTAPTLRNGVLEAARTAVECLLLAIDLRDRIGRPQPPALPALVSPASDLPFARTTTRTRWLVRQRLLARALESAATDEPAAAKPYLVRTVSLPPDGYLGVDLGTLAGYALPAVLPWTSDTLREDILDILRLWANAPIGDSTGTCRILSLAPAGGEGQSSAERQLVDKQLEKAAPGELWRTPNGALLILSYQRHDRTATAVEYAPNGTFDPIETPGWQAARAAPIPCWANADRIVRLIRLLTDRGPAPIDAAATVHNLAERAGLGVADAVAVCKFPADVLDDDIPTTGATLSFPMRNAVRERLLPDDPADLWITGLATDAAADWWRTHGE